MTWGVPLSVSYHFAFHTVHGVLKSRVLKWFAIPFSSGSQSLRPLHHDLPILGCPTVMACFHWVRQGCGPSVISLTSFLWVWFQCVCPLMPSCNTYHLTWVSLTLGVEYLFMAAPAKCSHCSLPWLRGISSPLPFQCGTAPLGPLAPSQRNIKSLHSDIRSSWLTKNLL